jgi:hypothetical protein
MWQAIILRSRLGRLGRNRATDAHTRVRVWQTIVPMRLVIDTWDRLPAVHFHAIDSRWNWMGKAPFCKSLAIDDIARGGGCCADEQCRAH